MAAIRAPTVSPLVALAVKVKVLPPAVNWVTPPLVRAVAAVTGVPVVPMLLASSLLLIVAAAAVVGLVKDVGAPCTGAPKHGVGGRDRKVGAIQGIGYLQLAADQCSLRAHGRIGVDRIDQVLHRRGRRLGYASGRRDYGCLARHNQVVVTVIIGNLQLPVDDCSA